MVTRAKAKNRHIQVVEEVYVTKMLLKEVWYFKSSPTRALLNFKTWFGGAEARKQERNLLE